MKIFHNPSHIQHEPLYEIFNGEQTPHNEVPARVERISAALETAGYELEEAHTEIDRELLFHIHDSDYLEFLERRCNELTETQHLYPSVFQYHGGQPRSQNPVAQLGRFSFDLYTPLLKHTWSAALASARCAHAAAVSLHTGQRASYALCRPPGHHAASDQMGGYCYLNNAAVAAEYLGQFGRVATLDVDFHHGNGTQQIFYRRADVFATSIHADPNWKFPYFSGFENETGEGAGAGFNLNRSLSAGTTNQQYQSTLEAVLAKISEYAPAHLVVSLGLDTHEADPIGGFALTTEYFEQMAQTILSLNLPTVIVQEGGYNTDLLGENVVSFLAGFSG